MAINYPFFSLGNPGAWRESFGPLWHNYWSAYIAATGDDQLFEVAAPLLAWRGLVLASPTWYPELSSQDRDRVLSFVEDALAAASFSPETAGEYFDT